MINLVKEGTSNTFAISPATASLYHDLASGSFELDYTQDYDKSSGSLDLTKLPPIPAGYYNDYLLFSLPSSDIPARSGFYSYDLREYIAGTDVWSLVTSDWDDAEWKWSEGAKSGLRTIDSGRVKILSTDQPTYVTYVGGDQDGQYTTYNK